MPRQIALLRGINIGPRNRVGMPELRKLLGQDGFGEVQTYVQSGNVVLDSELEPGAVGERLERLIAKRLDLDISVVVRTRDELAAVVAADPLGDVAVNPKRYQVSFLASELAPEVVAKLEAARTDPEALVVSGREIYAWHPEGVARSKLWSALGGRGLGTVATSRNWTTVTTLLAMADGQA